MAIWQMKIKPNLVIKKLLVLDWNVGIVRNVREPCIIAAVSAIMMVQIHQAWPVEEDMLPVNARPDITGITEVVPKFVAIAVVWIVAQPDTLVKKKNVLENIALLVAKAIIRPPLISYIIFIYSKENNMKKTLIITAITLLSLPAWAQSSDCVKVPTCAEMGYKLTAPKGDGWFCTACPTDPTKFACTAKPCKRGATTHSCYEPYFPCWAGRSGDSGCYYCSKKKYLTSSTWEYSCE